MKVASKAINKVKLKIDRGTSKQHVFGVATKKFYQNHTLYEKGNTLIERKIDVKAWFILMIIVTMD